LSFNYFKLFTIFSLASLLVVYTNCGKPSELIFESNIYGGSTLVSVKSFEKTVYPITRANCISCHASQEPLHASDDVLEAHNAVISQFKVNFANIASSRLVAKVRDENHNCWGDCAANGAEMQAAIEQWNDDIKDSGPVVTNTDLAIYTEETDTMQMEFNDSTNPLKSNSVKLDINAAMLTSPMIKTTNGDLSYLWVPSISTTALSTTDTSAGVAYMNFRVPASGTYKVWGQGQATTSTDDSFYMNVRNGNTSVSGGVKQWTLPLGTQFSWSQVAITLNLSADTDYSMELREREDETKASAFIVTADPDFDGNEVDSYFGVTLSFDLSQKLQIPGVSFKIDVVDYDSYSYKFSKPRIVSSNTNVYAKNVKIYVNGVFSPQHSTYTLVDKITTPEDGILSSYSMIVLKDRGASSDHIKFSFEKLEVAGAGNTTGSSAGGTTGGANTQTSLMAFESTVYPISRSSAYTCVGCHMSVNPRHASSTLQTAHDAALTMVDFNNPANSKVVNKMKVLQHNCGNSCNQIGDQYINAITNWKNLRE
jgi:hypothetical protein